MGTQLAENYAQAVGVLMPDQMWASIYKLGADPLMDAFPLKYEDAAAVQWDMYENTGGLIPLRGLDAVPDVVHMNGWDRYIAKPAYFGMVTQVKESELTTALQPGTVNEPLDVGDRMTWIAQQSAGYIVPRFLKEAADLVATGKIDIQDDRGRRFSYKLDNYTNQLKVPGTGWFTSASSATPIQDLLNWSAALQTGTDSLFGEDSVLLATSQTIAEFLAIAQIINTYKAPGGATAVLGYKGYNKNIAMEFGLPNLQPYDKGYWPTPLDAKNRTNFTKIIPPRTLLWIGKRPSGPTPGQWQLTRHAGVEEADGAGDYPEVDTGNPAAAEIGKGLYMRCHYHNRQPHHYDFEAGFNGMPIIRYPSAFAAISYT